MPMGLGGRNRFPVDEFLVTRVLESDRKSHVHFDDHAWQAPERRSDSPP